MGCNLKSGEREREYFGKFSGSNLTLISTPEHDICQTAHCVKLENTRTRSERKQDLIWMFPR